jgi:putative membrane protein
MGAFTIVAVFIAGIMVGILSFSRLLNWLLVNAHATTMAALIGLMAGSLRKIWPFQATTAAGYENVLPVAVDATVMATAGMFVLGLAIVIAMTVAGARKEAHALPSGA